MPALWQWMGDGGVGPSCWLGSEWEAEYFKAHHRIVEPSQGMDSLLSEYWRGDNGRRRYVLPRSDEFGGCMLDFSVQQQQGLSEEESIGGCDVENRIDMEDERWTEEEKRDCQRRMRFLGEWTVEEMDEWDEVMEYLNSDE